MLNESIKAITDTLADIHTICTENGIDYRVIGSAAMIGAVGHAYRNPQDVDFLFEMDKRELLYAELIKRGYQQMPQTNLFDAIFPEGLVRFQKGTQICEPRGGRFTDQGFTTDLLLPIPFLPRKLRPKAKLWLGELMSAACSYKINGVEFIGISREALYSLLEVSQTTLRQAEGSHPKRLLDQVNLNKDLDSKLLQELKSERSGIYFSGLPIVTLNNSKILNFLATLASN